ncbi:TPA: hypothetical protein VJ362_000684 [Streptococcus pyogenes]|nr:hypothetical protein [Streptococcus pyogenes]HER2995403.1 hypothetical protein [Streptococcus pyogenes]
MKTKSKRFLNLATLCLALLGTTLLMARPVKAEVIPVTETEGVQKQQTEDTFKKEYMDRFGLDRLEGSDLTRYRGYSDGYEKGLNGENRPERNEIQVPDDVRSLNEDSDYSDYRDGYEDGFGEGRHKGSPIQALLEDILEGVWGFLTSLFGGESSNGTSSQ